MQNKNIFTQMGASSHSVSERQKEDFYSTDPRAVHVLFQMLSDLNIDIPDTIIETSVGMGHIAYVCEEYNKKVIGFDIVDRGYPGTIVCDFLSIQDPIETNGPKMFIQNPPFKLALKFIERSLQHCDKGEYCCAFLKIQFLEGKERAKFFEVFPPKYVGVFSSRVSCSKNGGHYESSAMCYCWFIWEKGYEGRPQIVWINK